MPYPHTYWLNDNSIITNGSRLEIVTNNVTFSAKNFTCHSENAFGYDTKFVTVNIIGKIILCLCMFEIVKLFSFPCTIRCASDAIKCDWNICDCECTYK